MCVQPLAIGFCTQIIHLTLYYVVILTVYLYLYFASYLSKFICVHLDISERRNPILTFIFGKNYRVQFRVNDKQQNLSFRLVECIGNEMPLKRSFNVMFDAAPIITSSTTKNSHIPSQFTQTGFYGMIFLTSFISLLLLFCLCWLTIFYYRQFKFQRRRKKLRQAIARSIRKVLDQSPLIIYNANDDENKQSHDDNDDGPICSICLEPFKDKEKLRRLCKSLHMCM